MNSLPRLFLFAALATGVVVIHAPAAYAADDAAPVVADLAAPVAPIAAPTDAAGVPTAMPTGIEVPSAAAAPVAPAPQASTATQKHSKAHAKKSTKAKAKKHKTSHKKSHKKSSKKAAPKVTFKLPTGPEIHDAQVHLINLGYYQAPADGVLGPKTVAAIKTFQKDHKLVSDGNLTEATLLVLASADKTNSTGTADATLHALPSPDFYAKHPDYYGHYDQTYGDALQLAREKPRGINQGLPSRFAELHVAEVPSGNMKRYDVTVNGNSILLVDNQPSVIGISKTFDLGNEDAIVLSTYNNADPVCAYKSYLLTLHQGANELRPIDNCTRRYLAEVKEGSLLLVFPETDDDRAVGATYRYEPGSELQKL